MPETQTEVWELEDEEEKRMSKKLLVWSVAVAVICAVSSLMAKQPDPATVVGPVKCAECHKVESKIWEDTHHFATFTELQRRDTAREIADKLSIRRIKAESLCLDCHYLSKAEDDGDVDAIAGIACESCHGGARDWVKVHGEFSGHETEEQESAAEEAARWEAAEAAGMIRPQHVYRLAKNCFACHIVPEERLVNVGGHAAGSPFELVSWSQGEVRHNTWHTPDKANREATQERKRLLFVVGTAVELEESLRAVAKGTEKDRYAVSMAKRAALATKRIAKIAEMISVPEIDEIVQAAGAAELKLNNADELLAAAEAVAAATQRLAAAYDGSAWAALDAVIPSATKGDPAPGGPIAGS